MTITFYQSMLSIHQAPTIRALTEMGHDVTVVVDQPILADRRRLGYPIPDLGQARIIVAPTRPQMRRLIGSASDDAFHIVGGLRSVACSRRAIMTLMRHPRKLFGILSEAADPRGLKGLLRQAVYRADYWTWGWRARFVLGMGDMGVACYRRAGHPATRTFPFCYTVDGTVAAHCPALNPAVRVGYVGSLIPRKSVDTLLMALGRLPELQWEAHLIGEGPCAPELRSLATRLRLDVRITLHGSLPNEEVLRRVADLDILVLPSHFDGWGAVVNEALSAGTMVVCSDACGASVLLKESWRGSVFRRGDVVELARCLGAVIRNGPLTYGHRERIRAWSQCISGLTVAHYLVRVLDHVLGRAFRPPAPWEGPLPE